MTLGAHLAPRARSFIEEADTVFVAASDPLVELWVQQMHGDVRSLQPYYEEGKSRNESYVQMVDAMLELVRDGRRVCGAFYGHPGVFACVPHRAIDRARSEGFDAIMEAAVSAEDCLYADLGIDPGSYGCQHYETSQFMMYRRRIDPTALLVLWQVGVAGDPTLARFGTGAAHRKVLLEVLSHDYPVDHFVTIYEAATLPLAPPRIELIRLNELVGADLTGQSTLVIPPSRPMELNLEVASRLADLEA